MTKYRLKIDILENNGLTTTYDGKHINVSLEDARYRATEVRGRLFKNRTNGELKDYVVDIVPYYE